MTDPTDRHTIASGLGADGRVIAQHIERQAGIDAGPEPVTRSVTSERPPINPTETDTPIPPPASSTIDIISGWLPAHTHLVRPAAFSAEGHVWSWTTPEGLWAIRWRRPIMGQSTAKLAGFGVKVELSGPSALEQLHAVLVLLKLIPAAVGV